LSSMKRILPPKTSCAQGDAAFDAVHDQLQQNTDVLL
jgi:hypothetical protein